MVFQILDGLFKGHHAFQSMAFIESEVGLIGHAIRGCGINDRLVEGEDRISLVFQMFRNLADVCVETDAKKGFLREDLVDKLLSVHIECLMKYYVKESRQSPCK